MRDAVRYRMPARRFRHTFATVRSLALKMPGVEEGTAWGVPALRVHGRFFACMAAHRSAEPNTLVVMLPFAQRDAMIEDAPDVYYLKPHYVSHPCVLARLSQLDRAALADLLTASCRFVDAAAKKRPRAPRRAKS